MDMDANDENKLYFLLLQLREQSNHKYGFYRSDVRNVIIYGYQFMDPGHNYNHLACHNAERARMSTELLCGLDFRVHLRQ